MGDKHRQKRDSTLMLYWKHIVNKNSWGIKVIRQINVFIILNFDLSIIAWASMS